MKIRRNELCARVCLSVCLSVCVYVRVYAFVRSLYSIVVVSIM